MNEKIKKNAVIIFIVTLIVMYFVLKDDFSNILDIFLRLDLKYIFLALLFYFLSIFFKAYISYKSVDEKEKYSLKESIKHNVITQFFNGITPFSTGGQPMEIYMLTKHGINANRGTMIILQNFIFYQIALVLLGILAVSYNYIFHIFPNNDVLKNLVLLGFIINTLVAVGIILISISHKFTRFLVFKFIAFLSYFKLIKHKEEKQKKWDKRLEEFHECADSLRKRKMLFVMGVFLNVLSLICLYIIPLLIAYSMSEFMGLNVMNTLTSSAYVLLIGAFVPIPGASGGIEYGFVKFFGNFLSNSMTNAILLIWRFITYYFGMIIGMIAFNLDERSNRK